VLIQAHGPLKLLGVDETAITESGIPDTFNLNEEEMNDTQ
jgi:hypothetical protein